MKAGIPRDLILLLTLSVLIVVGIVFSGKQTSHLDSETRFYYPLGNIDFILLAGWGEAGTSSAKLPAPFTSVDFLLEKGGTSCRFALVRTTSEDYNTFKQVSFADQVSSPYFDGNSSSYWYVQGTDLPKDLEFSGGRRPMVGEVRLIPDVIYPANSADNESGVLALFDSQGGVVDDGCSKDVSYMLSTTRPVYEEVTLDNTSEGQIYFQSRRDGFHERITMFMYKGADSIPRRVAFIDDPMGYMSASMYKNEIWYSKEGALYHLDPFNPVEELAKGFNAVATTTINDFFLFGDEIYYLGGQDCRDFKQRCDGGLYKYDLLSGQSELLADNVPLRTIFGYDPVGMNIGLAYSDGDGGCSWGSGTAYSLRDQALVSGPGYGGCVDDPGFEEDMAAYAIFAKRFSVKNEHPNGWYVKDGILSAPEI